jgi:hypothetical protein
MAGAQIGPKNRPLDRKEKREECVLCARRNAAAVAALLSLCPPRCRQSATATAKLLPPLTPLPRCRHLRQRASAVTVVALPPRYLPPPRCRHSTCRRRAAATLPRFHHCRPAVTATAATTAAKLPPPPLHCRHGRPAARSYAPLPCCRRRSADAATALPPPTPCYRRRRCAACCCRAAAPLLPPPSRCRQNRQAPQAVGPSSPLTGGCSLGVDCPSPEIVCFLGSQPLLQVG